MKKSTLDKIVIMVLVLAAAFLYVFLNNKQVAGFQLESNQERPKYNAFTDRYEWAHPKDSLRFNPYTGQHSYQEPGSRLKYNPRTNEFNWIDE
jgi:hypothetical protein